MTKGLKFVSSIACLVAGIIVGTSVITAQSFNLFAVSDLGRIFEDGYKLPNHANTMELFGIRGEILSGQLVINAKKSLNNVTVEVSALKKQFSDYSLPVTTIQWNFVGSIPITKNTPNQPSNSLVRKAPARFPDYLMTEKQISVNSGAFQSIWLTLSIPETAEAGKFIGKITIRSSLGEQSLPLSLSVYPLTMPAGRHLNATIWYETNFGKYHDIQDMFSPAWFAMLAKYAENMAEHRQNVFRIPMNSIQIRKSINGELQFDFTRFDQLAQIFWNTKKMDYLETGFLAKFRTGSWRSTEITLKDFDIIIGNGEKITLPGEDVIPYLLPAFEKHLKMKGWLTKTLFHIQDEPSTHNSMAWNKISTYLHQYAPNLIRIDAIETTFVLNNIEIAVPKLDHFGAWYDQYKKAQQSGVELWFYTVGIFQASLYPNKTIDMPLIDSRIIHWLNYKYDATGYLHWGWNIWTDNPYQNAGEHIGDGWHVYPVKNGVNNSLRWEEMRNGMEDYEYFWMLENKVKVLKDSLGSKFSWIDPKQRSKEIAGKIVMSFTERSDDPKELYSAKMDIIRELMDFNSFPRIYIQTVPLENSVISSGSTVEVSGWTEPGTKIVVNGQTVPVDKQGLFLVDFGLFSHDIIRVQATSRNGSKEILRHFMIK
jgi:hypothetical protein